MDSGNLKVIAHIYTDFPQKFGLPRQSGLVKKLKGRIVFNEEYRNIEAFRGLEEYSYIWILWHFNTDRKQQWSPTVKPPRLGGNKRMGVFATRSPFRPNSIGLSSVKLEEIIIDKKDGPVLIVSGIDMMDKTQIYDIKPYLPYTDSHPGEIAGFSDKVIDKELVVEFPENLVRLVPEQHLDNIVQVLMQDPRPAYIDDENRVFGVAYAGLNINFVVKENKLKVVAVESWNKH